MSVSYPTQQVNSILPTNYSHYFITPPTVHVLGLSVVDLTFTPAYVATAPLHTYRTKSIHPSIMGNKLSKPFGFPSFRSKVSRSQPRPSVALAEDLTPYPTYCRPQYSHDRLASLLSTAATQTNSTVRSQRRMSS